MSRRQARVVVTKELVLSTCHLPAGTEIVDVCISRDTPNAIDVVLVHPDFPECPFNEDPPVITAQYETVYPPDGGKPKHPWQFTGWRGLPEPVETPHGP